MIFVRFIWFLVTIVSTYGRIGSGVRDVFSLTSHGKVVMCNVLESQDNNGYSLSQSNLNLCTHLIYFKKDNNAKDAWNFFNSSLNEMSMGKVYKELPEMRAKYPHLKIYFGIKELPVDFSSMTSIMRKRQIFIKNAVKFMQMNHFDGMDLNWDFSKERYNENHFIKFVQELKEHMQWNNLSLSSWIDLESDILDSGEYLLVLSKKFDFMHFTPRYGGSDNKYSLNDAIKQHGINQVRFVIEKLIETGVPLSKIVIGFNIGGMQFDIALRTSNHIRYSDICKLLSNKTEDWTETYDTNASLAVAKKKDRLFNFWRHVIVYENRQSIVHRVRLAMDYNLAGTMITSINTDDWRGECAINDEVFDDFKSSHVKITLRIPAKTRSLPLLNSVNMMMVVASYEIAQEKKQANSGNLSA